MKRSAVILHNATCVYCERKTRRIYDTRTIWGMWAYLCPACFHMFGSASLATEHENR